MNYDYSNRNTNLSKIVNEYQDHIRQTVILTRYYNFDLGKLTITELLVKWTRLYSHDWLPLAVTEAIYRGRLKAISIEQILSIWQKKGAVYYSFNYDFIRLVQPDSNLQLLDGKELRDILAYLSSSKYVSLDSKLPSSRYYSSEKNLGDSNNKIHTVLPDFQPVEDYSQCFQKLKSLAINTV